MSRTSQPTTVRTGSDDAGPQAAIAAPGPQAAIAAATRCYLAGEQLDMTALAAELGVGRATLYRWVGGRAQLLEAVLIARSNLSFENAKQAAHGDGIDFVVDVCENWMHSIVAAAPLKRFTDREPMLYLRLATTPGTLQHAAANCLSSLLDEQQAAGTLTLPASPVVLGEAIVRVCDSRIYSHLLGGTPPDVDTAVTLIRLLLRG